ncbi:MAG: 1-phosphofructokinase family hexose kinase [Anaerolineae bacterium]|nr:1-phosphofructokinase family hexose kinase [Anaerolineae bacterium]
MLLGVAPNPTIDHTLHVPEMVVGAVHRATRVARVAGGKGLNVVRAAHLLGAKALATAPLGGHAGQVIADFFNAEGLAANWYWLAMGETRTCLLVTHDTGDATVINEPGPVVSKQDWQGFMDHIKGVAGEARAVAIAGSLPLGVEPETLGVLARSLAASDRMVYLDTSGAALHAALGQPGGLCIKVNRRELAAGLQLPLENVGQLVKAGQTLLARGAALIVVTLGREGALAIAPEGCWQASAPPVEIVSTVGSGDSLLAGLAVACLQEKSIGTALAMGVACGAANALNDLPGGFEPREVTSLLERVNLKKLNV